jgi:hypothetical protein
MRIVENTMKRRGYCLALLLGALVLVGTIGCERDQPVGKTGAPSNSATESTGQAIVDSIKTPLDKARQVGDKLEKAAERTDDAVKDATQ